MLTSVSAAYLQRNMRPKVESITVHPAGIAFQKPFSTGEMEIAGLDEEPAERRLASQGAGTSAQPGSPALGRRIYQRGLQTLAWKAADENGDELTYSVLYRREGETSWRTLRTPPASWAVCTPRSRVGRPMSGCCPRSCGTSTNQSATRS